MTAPLAGLTVVVTRPQRQAGPFIELATQGGARCIALPAIAIEPVALGAAERVRLAPDAHDWAIYTSANAVEASLDQLPRPTRCRISAVGRATARALEAHGLAVHALPEARSDSEGLLALSAFAAPQGRRILVLRGVGGRELLRDQLQARGAIVNVAEVYRRLPGTAEPGALAALADAVAVDSNRIVVAVTSVEVLDGLLGLLPGPLADRLRCCALVLPGERVANAARTRRWLGPILVAATAEDSSMLGALAAHTATRGAGAPP